MKHLLLAALLLLSACRGAVELPADATYRWESRQTGTGAYDQPETEFSLVDAAGTVHYRTTCMGAHTEWAGEREEEEDIVTMTSCYWAGGGHDYAVINRNGSLGIYSRWMDEEAGYGPWEVVLLD